MLTVDPLKRPTAKEVLKMKSLAKRDGRSNDCLKIPQEKTSIENKLLGTIRMPKNLK